jgi:hypothetical protein
MPVYLAPGVLEDRLAKAAEALDPSRPKDHRLARVLPYYPGHSRRRIPHVAWPPQGKRTLRRTGTAGGMRRTTAEHVPPEWKAIYANEEDMHKVSIELLADIARGLEPAYTWVPPEDERAWGEVQEYLVHRTSLRAPVVRRAMCVMYPLTRQTSPGQDQESYLRSPARRTARGAQSRRT